MSEREERLAKILADLDRLHLPEDFITGVFHQMYVQDEEAGISDPIINNGEEFQLVFYRVATENEAVRAFLRANTGSGCPAVDDVIHRMSLLNILMNDIDGECYRINPAHKDMFAKRYGKLPTELKVVAINIARQIRETRSSSIAR